MIQTPFSGEDMRQGEHNSPRIATGAVPPTGYRVSILQSALEVSARLATAEELQNLIKVLQSERGQFGECNQKDSSLTLSQRPRWWSYSATRFPGMATSRFRRP